MSYDAAVVGAGIVGASTAWQLQRRHPGARIVLIEKHASVGTHQSAHNSGVIHAGVYYQPGSLKARFCREGAAATEAFCREHGIAFERRGKLLVATDTLELDRMEALYRRCAENGIEAYRLDGQALRAREPNVAGRAAIFVPSTGIVDFAAICRRMTELFVGAGGELLSGTAITAIEEDDAGVTLRHGSGTLRSRWLVTCAGLQADRLARMNGLRLDFRIVPFRGEFYRLPPERDTLIHHLVYPIPDPALPFLGVHLTPTIDGGILVGPNAVLALAREGYGPLAFDARDVMATLGYAGFWRLMRRHLRHALAEARDSLWKAGYLRRVRRYCPDLTLADLRPYPPGIRAQAVLDDGSLAHDFLFAESGRSLHVCNAPSPAATSALPIGAHVCARLEARAGASLPGA